MFHRGAAFSNSRGPAYLCSFKLKSFCAKDISVFTKPAAEQVDSILPDTALTGALFETETPLSRCHWDFPEHALDSQWTHLAARISSKSTTLKLNSTLLALRSVLLSNSVCPSNKCWEDTVQGRTHQNIPWFCFRMEQLLYKSKPGIDCIWLSMHPGCNIKADRGAELAEQFQTWGKLLVTHRFQ